MTIEKERFEANRENKHMQTKLIREARFGPAKCWKTGAVISSYPRPLLSLQFDEQGNDICTEPIVGIDAADMPAWCKKQRGELPPLSTVDFRKGWKPEMTTEMTPGPNNVVYPRLVTVVNLLRNTGCPWRTILVDSTTSIQSMIHGYIAATTPTSLQDPRKWASAIGGKIDQMIVVLSNLPDSHLVIIMHADTDKNELTSTITTSPLLYGKLRLFVGGTLSQFFYQEMRANAPTLFTQDTGYVKGIGARWPDLRTKPTITPPTFQNIYGDIP